MRAPCKIAKFGRGIHTEWMQVNCAWIIYILRGWAKLVKHTWAKGAERFSLAFQTHLDLMFMQCDRFYHDINHQGQICFVHFYS